jgi:hypothetical protein
MTTVSDGLKQWGGSPVASAPRFAGMWSGKVWFVDGTSGSNGNSGRTPSKAFLTLAYAVSRARTNDTIYIKPLAVGVRYTENITVPVATHAGLNIIGTGNGFGNSVYQACSVKGATGTATPFLTLNSSFANIENLHFYSTAAQVTNGFAAWIRWNVSSALNIGSSLVNCAFTTNPDSEATAGATQPAVRCDSTEGILVQGCSFKDCRIGVSVGSTASASDSINILDNQFVGLASKVAADIYVTDCTNMNIIRNIFGHAVPTNSAGSLTKYIYVAGTTTGTVAANYQGASDVAAGTNNTLGSLISAGNFGLGGPWTS